MLWGRIKRRIKNGNTVLFPNLIINCFFVSILGLLCLNFFSSHSAPVDIFAFLFVKCDPKGNIYYIRRSYTIVQQNITFQNIFRENQYIFIYEPGKTYMCWFPSSGMVREIVTVLLYQNVFFNAWETVATTKERIGFYDDDSIQLSPKETGNDIYDNIIVIYSVHGSTFGHLLHDILPILIKLPQDLYNRSYISLNNMPETLFQITDVLGYPREKFVLNRDNYLFARNLYVYKTFEPINGLHVSGCPLLQKVLRKKFDLEKIEPTRYVISNRDGNRMIRNFKEVSEEILTKIPNIPWEIVVIPYHCIAEYAKILATVKVWFTPCGSNACNAFFMKSGTGICLSMSQNIDMANFAICYSCNQWAIGFINVGIEHFNLGGGMCTIELAIKSLNALLYAMKHKSWPTLNNSYFAFNINETKKRMNNVYSLVLSDFTTNDQIIY